MTRRRLIALGGLIAGMLTLASAQSASAFYWYGWPGSKLPPDRTVITPPHDDKPGNPPDRPPVNPPSEPPPPTNPTPEPGTALAALIGIGALAARRAWQKKK